VFHGCVCVGVACQTDDAVPPPVAPPPPHQDHEEDQGPIFVIDADPLSSTFLTPASLEEDVDARHSSAQAARQSTSFSSFPEYVAMKRNNPKISPRDRKRNQQDSEASVNRRGSGGSIGNRQSSRTKSK
jgi:hypothetical protein